MIALSHPRIGRRKFSKVNLPSTVSIVHESSRFQLGVLISWLSSLGNESPFSSQYASRKTHRSVQVKAVNPGASSPSRASPDIYSSGESFAYAKSSRTTKRENYIQLRGRPWLRFILSTKPIRQPNQ